jgi:hypothetical protein
MSLGTITSIPVIILRPLSYQHPSVGLSLQRHSLSFGNVPDLCKESETGRIRPITPPRHALETRVQFGSRRRLQTPRHLAAETAAVEAKPLPVNAVKNMSVQDAGGILTGGTGRSSTPGKRERPKARLGPE